MQIWEITKYVNIEELGYFKNMLEACVPSKNIKKLPPTSYIKTYSEAPTIPFHAVKEEETIPMKTTDPMKIADNEKE